MRPDNVTIRAALDLLTIGACVIVYNPITAAGTPAGCCTTSTIAGCFCWNNWPGTRGVAQEQESRGRVTATLQPRAHASELLQGRTPTSPPRGRDVEMTGLRPQPSPHTAPEVRSMERPSHTLRSSAGPSNSQRAGMQRLRDTHVGTGQSSSSDHGSSSPGSEHRSTSPLYRAAQPDSAAPPKHSPYHSPSSSPERKIRRPGPPKMKSLVPSTVGSRQLTEVLLRLSSRDHRALPTDPHIVAGSSTRQISKSNRTASGLRAHS